MWWWNGVTLLALTATATASATSGSSGSKGSDDVSERVSKRVSVITPSDEMQKFIDECDYMIEEMSHCAEGWVALEQEMLTSVDSFADHIVFTESLIMEETLLILDMADNIVQTEEILIDIVESCDCSAPVGMRDFGVITHKHELRNRTKTVVMFPQRESTSGGVVKENSKKELFNDASLLKNDSFIVGFDKCSVMDDIVEVMDACIDAFVVYNDDFLQVLSYMDAAIQDMGARIVNTECLIVNMSYQIGDMADLIVDTEVLMADMAKSCCRGNNKNNAQETKSSPVLNKIPLESLRSSTGDDDLLSDCEFDGFQKRSETFSRSHALQLMKAAHERLQENLKVLPPITQKLIKTSYVKRIVAPALSQSTHPPPQDMMPCETWWDPFCCAAEVCADIMVEMIEMMAGGADWMEEVCESCIDEIGNLADDIVKTEENIILMGYAINEMADYIVLFIEDGLEFMAVFCPSTQSTYFLRGNFKWNDIPISIATALRNGDGVKFKKFMEHMQVSPNETIAVQRLPRDVSVVVANQQLAKAKIESLQQVRSYYKGLQDNPFGEFVAMVDVMMEAMRVFTDTLADQTRLMTEMFEGLLSLSTEQAKMAGMVITMGGDVATMGASVQEEYSLMSDLDDCIFND